MNKKNIIIIILTILIIISGIIFLLIKSKDKDKDKNINNNENNIDLSQEISGIQELGDFMFEDDLDIEHKNEFGELDLNDKMQVIKQKFFVKGIMDKAQEYIDANMQILALNELLKGLANSPENPEIILKLANTYFELKNFSKSKEYFEKIKGSLSGDNLKKYILSLFHNTNLKNKQELDNLIINIDNLERLDIQDKFYYKTVVKCSYDFHECKKDFHDFIDKNQIISKNIENIKNAFINYENFQSGEIYYKNTLVISEFFKNGLYDITILLSKDILNIKPEYKPLLLMIGKGNYELGNLEESKEYLEKYYKLNTKDSNIAYILGIIGFRTRDYNLSNLYYNAALNNGYENTLDLRRKIVYNNYIIGNKNATLKAFFNLINEENSNIDDYSLAIYNYINQKNISGALEIINKGIEKFKNTTGYEILYGYLGWIYREQNRDDEALKNLEIGLKINSNNPLLNLNMGLLNFKKENYKIAQIYFRKTMNVSKSGEFFMLAEKKLEEIENLNK